MKKFLSLLTALLLLMGLIPAALAEEPIVITGMILKDAILPDASDNSVLDYIEEQTGIRVEITDDGPVVVADTNFVTEGSNDSATGNVADNDTPGADGLGHVEWNGLVGESSYTLDENNNVLFNNEIVGNLILGDDGKYTFTLDANYDVPQAGLDDIVLNYRLYDTDGDYKDSTLTISIDGDTKTPVIPGSDPNNPEFAAAEIVVDEALLPDGRVSSILCKFCLEIGG